MSKEGLRVLFLRFAPRLTNKEKQDDLERLVEEK